MIENFQVIKGEPTDEELAAVIMVLTAQAAVVAKSANAKLAPEWNAPHRSVRKSFEHGAGSWRRSALPHPY